jgi:diguanylate cyclase (GGDEF)-like protein
VCRKFAYAECGDCAGQNRIEPRPPYWGLSPAFLSPWGSTLRRPSPSLKVLLPLACAFVCLHALVLLVFRSQAAVLTYPFLLLCPTLVIAACGWRVATVERKSRSAWILLGAGMFLWLCGMLLSAWEDIFQHIPVSVAYFSDVCFFLFDVPILLAISSVSAEQSIPFFVWLDGFQALLTGYLTYVTIFSVTPLSGAQLQPVSISVLLLTYKAENVILIVASTLRLVAQPRGHERRFYEVLCAFLWVYGIMAWVYNDLAVSTDTHNLIDLMADLPFLFLAVVAVIPTSPRFQLVQPAQRKRLALFIENVSPIFYTVALLALSMSVIRRHFYEGMVGVFTALVVYGIRMTTLQGRHLRVQHELHEARDRLEAMALTDGLTNAANRRHFDQTLIIEWNRAVRNQEPLALLLVDIDYFKRLNDRYGHPAGDRCLISIAAALQSMLPRGGDLLARYGGEEFAAILPSTDEDGARVVAKRMQEAVRSLNIHNETPTGALVTVSIGITVFESSYAEAAEIVEAADQALYRAKESGRNRVEAMPQREYLRERIG